MNHCLRHRITSTEICSTYYIRNLEKEILTLKCTLETETGKVPVLHPVRKLKCKGHPDKEEKKSPKTCP